MAKKNAPDIAPAIGSPFHNWAANLLAYGPPSIKYFPRVFIVSLVSLIGAPFRWYESFVLRKELKRVKLQKDPVFILGHWRGGTTLLHNLICEDPQFGYITLTQALFPKSFMRVGIFRLFLKIFMPETRPMDNMKLSLDVPQEDELALSNISRHSLYNGWQFPWRLMDFYRKYVEFKGLSAQGKEAWWQDFHRLLKRTTYNMDGKQLVLKNPPHTARIKEILERYPNAKFIHIYRNPYAVYKSTRHLYRTAIMQFTVQKYADKKMDEDILRIYASMYRRYFKYRELIPAGNLVEIRYEEFEQDPVEHLRSIYQKLGIEGFETAKPQFENYMQSLGSYVKNKFVLSSEDADKVEKYWGEMVNKWNYQRPESS